MDLFNSPVKDFRVVRLTVPDAERNTDHLSAFRELVSINEDMYPGIRDWMKRRVLPGLKTAQRVAYVGYLDEKPVVSAVVKRGTHAKFCHLRIDEGLRNQHLGDLFFATMALEVRERAEEVHFTLPESLWIEKREFFESFGFHDATKAGTQYRLFDNELRCSAPFSSIWAASLRKLPKIMDHFTVGGYSASGGVLMSIKSEHASDILGGRKRVEIRRRFSARWVGHRVAIYATAPDKSLVGEATIDRVEAGTPDGIWDQFGSEIGCTRVQFDEYTRASHQVFAIVLDDVRPYRLGIPLTQVSHLLDQELTPPQSYCALDGKKPWAQAVSVAALLHGSLRVRPQSILR